MSMVLLIYPIVILKLFCTRIICHYDAACQFSKRKLISGVRSRIAAHEIIYQQCWHL
jgi:hypothetical protein